MYIRNGCRLLLLALVALGFGSCTNSNFLDETQTTDLDRQRIFSDSAFTVGFLYEIYIGIGFDTDPDRFSKDGRSHGGMHTACDEAEFKASSDNTTDMAFATGTVNPVTVSSDVWDKSYENIRRVNVFLANVDQSPISPNSRKLYKAQARFLRAWYYSIMLKHYGGIPLIGDDIFEAEDPRLKEIKRNTYKECVDYIVSECNYAAGVLPLRYRGSDQGQVDGGTCMALKSRVLLYSASKLFNGSDFAPDATAKELVGHAEYDEKRWDTARMAARDLIATGAYKLFVMNKGDEPKQNDVNYPDEDGIGFYWVFKASDKVSSGSFSGTIFEKKKAKGNNMEALFQPPTRGSCMGGYPYQNLVDVFLMKNGKAITDPTSGYDPKKPYEGREPRFYNTFIIDQTLVMDGGSLRPINIFLRSDGTPYSQDAVGTGTPTGYYFRKMQHRGASANYVISVPQSRPLIRYAEILLNYAEATNEWTGPDEDVYQILKDIRHRAGIAAGDDKMYGLKANMTKDEMTEAIRLERQIEFTLEGHRFWDIRRWMIYKDVIDGKQLKGMEIRLTEDGKSYKNIDVRVQRFRDAMYFWPLPYKEVAKAPNILQNPYY